MNVSEVNSFSARPSVIACRIVVSVMARIPGSTGGHIPYGVEDAYRMDHRQNHRPAGLPGL